MEVRWAKMDEDILAGRFEVSEDVLYQEVQDELVLLNLKSQKYYGLDSIGARMWHLLVEQGDTGAVADRICSEYDADRGQVLHDLQAMIHEFHAAGLVRARTAGDEGYASPPR